MSKSYGIKNFVRIAQAYANTKDISSFDEITRFLVGWFCLHYNTTFNDQRLQELTIEELLVLYNMNRIKDDPNYATEILEPSKANYEDWLKKEMGEDYISEEDAIKVEEKEAQEYAQSLKQSLPEKVSTDFSQFKND